MKTQRHFTICKGSYFLILGCILFGKTLFAQQLSIRDFTLFSGPNGPGTTIIGSSITINGGSVGSYKLVQTTGNATINANIHSGDKVSITNSNIINGRITAANSSLSSGTVISVGSSTSISGNIDSRGNIVIGGGTVSGTVTLPAGIPPPYTYSGPTPTGGVVYGTPSIPTLPVMPAPTPFAAAGSENITGSVTRGPGAYNNVTYGGNKTLTLDGPGIYIFNSFHWTGNSNKLIFDFKNQSGNFYIYVHSDADFGKLNASISNGGSASRIFTETHGTGSTSSIVGFSFIIANGSSGGGSKWMGSVYAPNGGINIGSGTGSSTLTGTLTSSTQVNIQSGVTLYYSPFTVCIAPNANAGIDKPLDFSYLTKLTGTSTTAGASFSWQAINGGLITSNPNSDTIFISAAGTYILTVFTGANCFAKDTVVITSRLKSVIGSELQSIYDNNTTSSPFFVIADGYVMIDVIVNAGYYTTVLNLLQNDTTNYGLRNIIPNGTSSFIITGEFPVRHLPNLNSLFTQINFCRPYYQGYNNSGLVNSAGDTTMRSYLVRKGYKVDGDGIKIGVLSDSYATITAGTTATLPLQPVTNPPNPIPQTFTTNTAAQDVANGDLPGDTTIFGVHVVNPDGYIKNVHVLQDFPVKRTDEGRAMLQEIHDVAPGAELYFRTAYYTAGDFALGIHQLKDAGCRIIVDDVSYITESFFKDDIIAKAANEVVQQGATYFSAGGNYSHNSYEKDFNPALVTSGLFAGKMAHNFGGGDMFQQVKLAPGNYTFVFQWTDSSHSDGETGGTIAGGTINDMDFYLALNSDCLTPPSTNGTSLFGFNRDNTGGDPIEFIPFTIPGTDSICANVFIVNNTTTSNPLRIKYIVFRGGIRIMEYNEGVSTIVGQANADSVIAVGAARFDKAPPYLNPPLIEPFSSIGGTHTANITGQVTIRKKPDVTAPDGANTTVKSGQDYPNSALDGYSNFFGTSAAAPHAAAVTALVMQGKNIYLGQPVTTPSEIRSLLQSTAIDMVTPGFDFTSGYGLINIDLAMRTFAAPTPSIYKLVIPVTSPVTIPGDTVFTLTVKGDNFSTNSIIYFRDSALASTVVLDTVNGIATAVIPKFEDNPPIRVYTPPRSISGLDGGFSNSLYFFAGDITVNAVNVTKKYGQQNPPLTAVIKINGKLLQDTTLTLDSIGLKNMTLTTPATTYSDVGTYIITFNQNIPADSFLQKFNYTFTNGALTIEKMPLTVTPVNQTITYGQYINNVSFNYVFDHTNVPDPDSILRLIKTYHQGYVPNNALAVIKDFSKTQADGSVLTSADLLNMNMIASFKAVKNSRKFQLDNNNELVPLINQNTFNVQYLVDVASESIFNYKKDPTKAKFFSVYPGINSKALLSASSLTNNTGKVEVNGSLIQMVSGTLVQMVSGATGPMVPIVNGSLLQVVNGQLYPVSNGSLVQMVSGTLVQLVSGEFVPLPDGTVVQFVNGTLVQMVSGTLVQLVSGVQTPIINAADITDITTIPNGSLVQMANGSLVQMVSGTLVQMANGSPVQLANGTLVQLVSGTLVQMTNGNSLGVGTANNNTAVILDEADVDFQTNWLGAMFGINMITGLDVGQQSLVPGVLVNSNFEITYGLGTVTINPDPCLLTHSPAKNFGSTPAPQQPTSLWLNLTTKVSGQLKCKGDSLLFKSGSITLFNINSTPLIKDFAIPRGKIIADNVAVPSTKFDSLHNIWITKVPVGFSSTSDIFIAGAIINSSTGFVKDSSNTYSIVKGEFYCNKNFKDQWGYGTAAYRPEFFYASIADSGVVTSINGTYRAGTPTSQLANLVQGGSGGGGNNYTGSTNSFDKFTACGNTTPPCTNSNVTRTVSSLNHEEVQDTPSDGEVQIIPNPATNYVMLSFVPARTGNSEIILFNIDGKKVFETNNGICEAGIKYLKKIDVSKLISGVYVVQLRSKDKITNKKIIINR
jgi:hypothetical protein